MGLAVDFFFWLLSVHQMFAKYIYWHHRMLIDSFGMSELHWLKLIFGQVGFFPLKRRCQLSFIGFKNTEWKSLVPIIFNYFVYFYLNLFDWIYSDYKLKSFSELQSTLIFITMVPLTNCVSSHTITNGVSNNRRFRRFNYFQIKTLSLIWQRFNT